jgi:hypothetical protein
MMGRRVGLSKRLPVTVRSMRHRGWTHLLTCDESWLWRTIDYEQQWLSVSAERPDRPRRVITSPKAMIILFWSPLRFPAIQTLPQKLPFTAEFLVDGMLPSVIVAKPSCDRRQRLFLHKNKASPHSNTVREPDRRRLSCSVITRPCALPFLSFWCTDASTRWPNLCTGPGTGGGECQDDECHPMVEIQNCFFLEWEEGQRRCINIAGSSLA